MIHRLLIGLFLLAVCFGLAASFPQSATFADCVNNNRADGLISSGDPSRGIVGFGNPLSVCVVNSSSIYTVNDFKSYADYKQLFYYLPKASVGLQQGFTYPDEMNGNATEANITTGNAIYSIKGSLTINGAAMTLPQNSVIVVFVDGDLTITSNIRQGVSNNKANGIVFVVNGVVNIPCQNSGGGESCPVNQIDAVIMAYNSDSSRDYTICTANEPDGSCPLISTSPLPVDQALTVNGTLADLNQPPAGNATADPKPIRFRRNLVSNDRSAETVNFDPKYLVVLKDVFSEAQKIETEIADYDPSQANQQFNGAPTATCPGQCTDALGQYNGGSCTNINAYGATATCTAPTQYCSSGCSHN